MTGRTDGDRRTQVGIALATLVAVGAVLLLLFDPFSSEPETGRSQVSTPTLPGAGSPSFSTLPAALSEAPAADSPQPIPAFPEGAQVAAGKTVTVQLTTSLVGDPSVPAAPGARQPIELGFSTYTTGNEEALVTVITDDEGKATVELPASALAELDPEWGPHVWARSSAPGMLRRFGNSHSYVKDGKARVHLWLQRGALVKGLILGPDDRPATGKAELLLDTEGGYLRVAGGVSRDDGRFEAEVTHEGIHTFLASGTSYPFSSSHIYSMREFHDLGTGVSEPFEVRFGEPTDLIVIRLSGPGVLRGRILDWQGRPAAKLPVYAVAASLDDEQGGLQFPPAQFERIEREGRGHAWLTATTDKDGGFVMRGLRNDLFHVRASINRKPGYPLLLTETPVPSTGQSLELRIARPHLAIHVRRVDGSLPDKGFRFRIVNGFLRWGEHPESPTLLVSNPLGSAQVGDLSLPPKRNLAGDVYSPVKTISTGEYLLELEGHDSFDVGFFGGGVPWLPQRIEVPPGVQRVDVHVVIPETLPLGILDVESYDSQGQPLEADIRIRLLDPASGVTLVDRETMTITRSEDWPQRFELPEGEYTLIVEGQAWGDRMHGTIMTPRGHGGFETSLSIRAGAPTTVRAQLSEGARVRLALRGSVTRFDRAAARLRTSGSSEASLEDQAARVRLSLEQAGRWPTPLVFGRFSGEGTSSAGTHLESFSNLGSRDTSELLTPGPVTLVARLPGGREIRRDVELTAGQTLSLTLDFN